MNPKEQVDKMHLAIKRGKDIHNMFSETVRTGIIIQGKTIEQWQKYFELIIPDTPDTEDCKKIDTFLMKFHQEATFLKCMAEATHSLGKRGYETQYREKFSQLVSEYRQLDKKLPAKETLEVLASVDLDDIETGNTYSELAIKFWKDIIDDLNFKRRAIENLTINNSVQAKLDISSGFTQNKKTES